LSYRFIKDGANAINPRESIFVRCTLILEERPFNLKGSGCFGRIKMGATTRLQDASRGRGHHIRFARGIEKLSPIRIHALAALTATAAPRPEVDVRRRAPFPGRAPSSS
jgi:hypothetical protein